ncbi:Acetyltransferase, gnat family [Alloactinosynnema sp. L-07]|uniref:GNAT family N-acetyltransferase n=1 Tax=Alloactinosynnema sp. L-07 TaxID=1653480 RepID=UPI00065F0640|nr:GNAT family N-acetyltransferase [Alloactinosynnema sp. L-07]CRK56433.1 Acetyltransferase, gnat family [Alloactinosynnema sp. L-07]
MVRPSPVLTGDIVVLRRKRPSDLAELWAVVDAALPHLRPWMSWTLGGVTEDTIRGHLADVDVAWDAGTEFGYSITIDGAIVGSCSLMARVGPGGIEIGYWLHPAHVGRGAALEAAALLVETAFGLPGVQFVEIVHDSANVRSGAIPRKLGFTEVARVSPPQDPITSAEDGVDVRWRLTKPR